LAINMERPPQSNCSWISSRETRERSDISMATLM
jgi:hypothetical protein